MKCKCGGEIVVTGDIKVLSDGYEIEIYKCKECGLEQPRNEEGEN